MGWLGDGCGVGLGWVARVARGLERDGLAAAPAGILPRASGSGGEHARVWANGWRGKRGRGFECARGSRPGSRRACKGKRGEGSCVVGSRVLGSIRLESSCRVPKVALSRHEVHEALGERVVQAVRADEARRVVGRALRDEVLVLCASKRCSGRSATGRMGRGKKVGLWRDGGANRRPSCPANIEEEGVSRGW